MGGHQSKQTVSMTSKILTKATYNSTQNCISVGEGSNVFSLYGDHNVVENVSQNTTLSVDSECSQNISQNQDFQTQLANTVVDSLKTQEVALTSWMTPGKSTQSSNVDNVVKNNITTNLVQNCLTQLSGTNVFSLVGSSNVVRGVMQSLTENKFGGCLGANSQVVKTSADVTNAVNQTMSDVQKNPFAFITDAIQSVVKNIAVLGGIALVALVMVVVLAALLRKHHKRSKERKAADPPAARR